jgi:hypothetical protein
MFANLEICPRTLYRELVSETYFKIYFYKLIFELCKYIAKV